MTSEYGYNEFDATAVRPLKEPGEGAQNERPDECSNEFANRFAN